MDWTVALLTTMGGATIGAGVNMPHLAKVRGRGGLKTLSTYYTHVKKSILYMFSQCCI